MQIYTLATQTLEQLYSKVTLQQQRTHASYSSAGYPDSSCRWYLVFGIWRQSFQSKYKRYVSFFTFTLEHWNNSYGSTL